ncbi:MAG: hypothetical protein J6W52_12030 [Bacteroidaceae bacterium]|nr:hypothetical protein [Bacteroidaceae bacterium]
MKSIKTIITALLLTAGMTAQAQQVMTVRTGNSNDKYQLTSRLVLDLTKKKPVVRTNSQVVSYAPGTSMLVYLMPTADDTYQIVDGTPSFYNPEDMFYKAITYTRNYQTTDWQLLYLPLKLEYSQWSNDFDIARLNDIHQYDTNNDGQIDETYLEVVMLTGGYTEPNTPYVIRAHKTGTQTITQQEGATLYASEQTEATVSNWDTYFTIRGTYNTLSSSELAGNTFYAVENNSLLMGGAAGGSLEAFRWFITVTDRNGRQSAIKRIKIFESNDAIDAIESTPALSENEGAVYDLSGRKVNGQVRKGVFIKNGKKVLVK